MKRIFFLVGALSFFLVSCSNNKHISAASAATQSDNGTLKGNLLNEDQAKEEIERFPYHKDQWPKRKKLIYASVTFDPADLKTIANSGYKEVKFFFAAEKSNDKDMNWTPTIIIRVLLPDSPGVTNHHKVKNNYVYYKASGVCPPPPAGCKWE